MDLFDISMVGLQRGMSGALLRQRACEQPRDVVRERVDPRLLGDHARSGRVETVQHG
jgi:hypothetical protein